MTANYREILMRSAALLLWLPLACEAIDVPDWGPITDNLRWTLDLSSRPIYFADSNQIGALHAVGFDTHKVFSTKGGDIATIVAQGYFTRVDNLQRQPGFFDDRHDWEFVFRIFNINWTGLGPGKPNMRFGHFEIPFGLEQLIDTNGTLRDYAVPQKIGIKTDWRVTINGTRPKFEYEFSGSIGGSQEFSRIDDSYVFAGRVGTPSDRNTILGISVYKSSLKRVERERVALDAQMYMGLYGVFSEISAGSTADETTVDTLFEVNWRNSNETWLLYAQGLFRFQDSPAQWNEDLSMNVGVKYAPDSHWTFSAEVTQEFERFSRRAPEDTIMAVQARYRF